MPSADVRVAYKPQGPVLGRFHRSKRFLRQLIGPLGSGKTQACIADLLHQIDTQVPDRDGVRRSRWAAARNTYRDLSGTTIKDFRAWTDQMQAGRFTQGGDASPTWFAKYRRQDGTRVEAEVVFVAFDVEADVKKARGLQLTGLWLNETKELHKANVDMLMSRVGRYPPRAQVPNARHSVIGDTNAPDRDHWLAKLSLNPPEDWEFFIQPGGVIRVGGKFVVNPAAENLSNLDPQYYYRNMQGKKESWIRQNLGNEFVFHSDGRPVHPDFNEQLHVGECQPAPGMRIVLGFDFGRTPAGIVMQRQFSGQWQVYHEFCTVNTSAHTFGKAFRRFLNAEYAGFSYSAWGDPSGSNQSQTRDETPFDMLLANDIDALPAPTNDPEERYTALDSNLTKLYEGDPAILIHPRCTTLIAGLAGAYQFKRVQVSGEDRYHDEPVKGPESHVCEALHYALLGEGEGQMLLQSDWGRQYRNPETGQNMESWAPDPRFFE